jgi:hypothetical protein
MESRPQFGNLRKGMLRPRVDSSESVLENGFLMRLV